MYEVSSLVLSFLYLIALPFMGFLIAQQYDTLPKSDRIVAGFIGPAETPTETKKNFEWVDPLASFISDAFQRSDIYEHRVYAAVKQHIDKIPERVSRLYETFVEPHMDNKYTVAVARHTQLWYDATARYYAANKEECHYVAVILGALVVVWVSRKAIYGMLKVFLGDVHNIEKGVNEMHRPISDDDDDDDEELGLGGPFNSQRSVISDFPSSSQFPTHRGSFRDVLSEDDRGSSREDDDLPSTHSSSGSSELHELKQFVRQYDTASSFMESQSSPRTAPLISSSASSLRVTQHHSFLPPSLVDSPNKSTTTTLVSQEKVVFKSEGTVGSLSTYWDEQKDSSKSETLISVD